MYQRGSHRRIPTTAEGANGSLIADFLTNRFDGFFDKSRAAPLGLRFAHGEKKISQNSGSLLGVVHFRVKLHGMNFSFRNFRLRRWHFRWSQWNESLAAAPGRERHGYSISLRFPADPQKVRRS